MFLRGYKPDWLYEVLPYAYLIAGLITIFTFKNVMGAVSGLLLTSTGAAVWLMRRSYRSAMQENPDQTSRGVDSGKQGTSLVKLIWRTSFEVGNEVIDRQHQGLVSLGNELINAVLTKELARAPGAERVFIFDRSAGWAISSSSSIMESAGSRGASAANCFSAPPLKRELISSFKPIRQF